MYKTNYIIIVALKVHIKDPSPASASWIKIIIVATASL